MTATKTNAAKVAKALTAEVNAVLLATAHAELMREKMTPVYNDVLDFVDARTEEGERVTNHNHAYRMAEKYETIYYAECDKRVREMGFDLQPGYCPALVAEELQRKAEHLLVEAAAAFFPGVTVNALICKGLETYRKYIDLLIGLVVNHPNYRKPAI